MSIDAMAQMRASSKARGIDRAVGIAVASYANPDTGLAYPSNETLCAEWGFSLRVIQRALRSLERLGELERRPELETYSRRRVYLLGSSQTSLFDGEPGARMGDRVPGTRLLTRAGSNGERGKNNTPPTPPVGGLAPDPFSNLPQSPQPAVVVERAAPARRRRTRRRPDVQGSVASEPCPLRHGHLEGELMKEWEQVQQRLRERLGQHWELWAKDAHPHRTADERLVIALAPEKVPWVQGRFGRMFADCAGCPLELVGCQQLEGGR